MPHHVLVWVSDMNRAVSFYTEILELPLLFKSSHFSKIGGEKFWISLHIDSKSLIERKAEKGSIINFKPDNMEEAYKILKEKSVEFYHELHEEVPGIWIAEFFDSEGNRLALSTAE